MRRAFTIANKEYRTYFGSPGAYIVMGMFTLIMSWMFFNILKSFSQRSMMMMMGGQGTASLTEWVFSPHFSNTTIVLMFLVPALTVRLFAEEKKSRTIDLLMTSPITATDIVVGKLLAAIMMVWTMVSIMAIYPAITYYFTKFDVGPLLSGLLGLYLLSGVFVAIGVFASSLTESMIVAYVVALVLNLFMIVIGWGSMTMEGPTAQAIFDYLSIMNHFGDFTKGTIDTSGVIYMSSLIFFFGFLTHRVVESARWR